MPHMYSLVPIQNKRNSIGAELYYLTSLSISYNIVTCLFCLIYIFDTVKSLLVQIGKHTLKITYLLLLLALPKSKLPRFLINKKPNTRKTEGYSRYSRYYFLLQILIFTVLPICLNENIQTSDTIFELRYDTETGHIK